MRMHVRAVVALSLFGLTACELGVTNYGSPDVERVLADAESVESALSGLGSQIFNPQRGSESVNTQAKIMAEESFASVANFGMAARAANRSLISNELGNDNAASNQSIYFAMQRLTRLTFNTLAAYNALSPVAKGTLSSGRTNRMRAFAYFVAGQAIGAAAAAYDSIAVADETIDRLSVPPLISAAAANDISQTYFDSARVIAARGMDDIPVAWMSTPAVVNQAAFIRLANSYRARYRAAVARTVGA